MIVDTHTHVISPDEHRYPLQKAAMEGGDLGAWPLHARVSADELEAEMAASGVARACLVQGYAAYGFDNRYTLAAAEAAPSRFVSVCALDTENAGAADQLAALADHPRLRGVRLVTAFMKEGEGLSGPGARRIFDAAQRLNLVMVILAFASELEKLAQVAGDFSGHPLVLDHCAFVDVEREFERLAPLAPLENVFFKVSTRVLLQGEPAGIARRFADRFGASRLMWGSDFPASHQRGYREWVELAEAGARGLSDEEARRFLGGTALELWPELR